MVLDDTALVRRCQKGDIAAMDALISKYQDRIYNVILKICQNNHDAAELTQDTFVKLIENINTFKGKSSFYTWLFRVAVNLTLNYCKRKQKHKAQSLETPVGTKLDGTKSQLGALMTDKKAVDPVVMAQNKEVSEIIARSLSQLDDNHRVIIVLRDIEGMTYAEIADAIGIDLGTVKSRLSRARTNLRKILETVL